MPLIDQLFPLVLLCLLPFALTFHPVPGARAVLFFIFGYFLTTALYSAGLFIEYGTRYHPLVFASAITIALYHSLDITPHLLVAWLAELFLIGLNASMILGTGVAPYLHWQITTATNLAVLLVLIGGWTHGSGRILYYRWIDLDVPLGFVGSEYRFAREKDHQAKGRRA